MRLAGAAPVLFVLIRSTGFPVARAVAPYPDPNLFLLVRFCLPPCNLPGSPSPWLAHGLCAKVE